MPFLTQGKTNWKFLGIAVVLAVVVGIGILWCVKTSEQSYPLSETKQPEKVIEAETADWQIYRNELYGFEIKIPSPWEVTQYGNKIWTFEFKEPDGYDYCNLQGYPRVGEIDLAKEAENYFPNKTIEITQPFEFNGYQGIKVKTGDSEYIFITSNGLVYNFLLGDSNICDEIFSTFRFIEVGIESGKIVPDPIEGEPGEFYLFEIDHELSGATGNYRLILNKSNSESTETEELYEFWGHVRSYYVSPNKKFAVIRYGSGGGSCSYGDSIFAINFKTDEIQEINCPAEDCMVYSIYDISLLRWLDDYSISFLLTLKSCPRREDCSYDQKERSYEYSLINKELKLISEREFLIIDNSCLACLAKGTKIMMADGSYKNIEDVKRGDFVKSFDMKIREIRNSEVMEVIERIDPIVNINNKLKAAPDHPIYLADGTIKPAAELRAGDLLFNDMTVDSVDYSPVEVDTYDLILKNAVNFFAEGYLVGTPH